MGRRTGGIETSVDGQERAALVGLVTGRARRLDAEGSLDELAGLADAAGAAVVLRPGATAGATELIDFVYDRLAPFQRPRHVHIVDSLPLGATGKVSRPMLAKALAELGMP